MNWHRSVLVIFLCLIGGAALWVYQPWANERRYFFAGDALAGASGDYAVEKASYSVETLITGLNQPWDLAFLGATELLVTEQAGRLLRIDLDSKSVTVVSGVPEVVSRGQGGLFSVVLHPEFVSTGLIYLSYAAEVARGRYSTRVMRAKLSGSALQDASVIFTATPASQRTHHFGGALLFGPKGHLFLSVGDRGDRDRAQDLDVHKGKVLRLMEDGRVPSDNPFVHRPGALPEIFSFGHRNPQGMDLNRETGHVWAAEHGPRGGDEINASHPGLNYGWPVITYGKEYVGGGIGEGTAKAGMEQPVHYFTPSIATAGLAYYDAAMFPEWKGSVFVAALRGHLNRVQLRDGVAVSESRLLSDLGQGVRAVRVQADGELLVATEQGSLLRIYR